MMINPTGEDTAREWLEIFNASAAPQVLNRLVIRLEHDGRTADLTLRDAGVLAPQAYFVMAPMAAPPEFPADYRYSGSWTLHNEQARLALFCKESVVDVVAYGAAYGLAVPQGRSLSFAATTAPDAALRNDDATAWCATPVEAGCGAGEAAAASQGRKLVCGATAGEANATCGDTLGAAGASPAEWCREAAGTWRPVRTARVGGLVINEVLANPEGVDNDREWIELWVGAEAEFDLNGLEISFSSNGGAAHRWTLTQPDCVPAAPATFVVLRLVRAGQTVALAPGGGVAEVVLSGDTLPNSAGLLQLRQQTVEIDRAAVPTSSSSNAWMVSAAALGDAAVNDTECGFCPAKRVGGTPGAGNDDCGLVCQDVAGSWRPVIFPSAGELAITEIYADPDNPQADDDRDWVELWNTGGEPFDLNGLKISNVREQGTPRRWEISSPACLTMWPGDYRVVGGKNAPRDGVEVAATLNGFSPTLLYNSAAQVQLLRPAVCASAANTDVLVTQTDYAAPRPGVSYGRDGAADAAAPAPVRWCEAVAKVAGFAGFGSPGRANTACP